MDDLFDPGLVRINEAVTWAAVYCAAFSVAYFAGTVVLRVMWNTENS